ncbi:hypothetical protein HDU78_001035 [Chytriomyces hyalinus]|nr:hypothetical protein HDU78_001035 [Chytriomyces hyalinus]
MSLATLIQLSGSRANTGLKIYVRPGSEAEATLLMKAMVDKFILNCGLSKDKNATSVYVISVRKGSMDDLIELVSDLFHTSTLNKLGVTSGKKGKIELDYLNYVKGFENTAPTYTFYTPVHEAFNVYRSMFYNSDGAIWIMDDGARATKGGMYLATHSFTREDLELLVDVLGSKFK